MDNPESLEEPDQFVVLAFEDGSARHDSLNEPGSLRWRHHLLNIAFKDDVEGALNWRDDDRSLSQYLDVFNEPEFEDLYIQLQQYRSTRGTVPMLRVIDRVNDADVAKFLSPQKNQLETFKDLLKIEVLLLEVQRDAALALLPMEDAFKIVRVPVQISWTLDLNAATGLLPSGRLAVFLDASLMLWCEILARSGFMMLSAANESALNESADVFADCLTNALTHDFQYLVSGFSTIAHAPALRDGYRLDIARVEAIMNQFIIAHEYGHAVHDHVTPTSVGREAQHEMEYIADDYAVSALLGKYPPGMTYLSLNIFMKAFALVEMVDSKAVATHPLWKERLESLNSRLLPLLPDEAVDTFAWLDSEATMAYFVEILRDAARPE